MRIPKKASPRARVRNATEKSYRGVTYRSKLEAFTAQALTEAGIPFLYEAERVVLQEKFTAPNPLWEFTKKKGANVFAEARTTVLPVTYTIDFLDPGGKWVCEVKGMRTDVFTLKFKWYRHWLAENSPHTVVLVPNTHAQVRECVNIIKRLQ